MAFVLNDFGRAITYIFQRCTFWRVVPNLCFNFFFLPDRDENGKAASGAKILVEGNDKSVETTERGEYWRLLSPGQHKIRAVGEGEEK